MPDGFAARRKKRADYRHVEGDWPRGGEGAVSFINEPFDYTIDYTVKVESALAIARQRCRHAELINGEDHER